MQECPGVSIFGTCQTFWCPGILFTGELKGMVSLTFSLTTMRSGGALNSLFPWKGVWKSKIPKRLVFFLWTATHGWILTLDNLILKGHPLANRCCMCCCDGELVNHLLLHCPVIHSLWTFMLLAFGILWVIPGLVAGLLSC